jgi:hypothetical protein
MIRRAGQNGVASQMGHRLEGYRIDLLLVYLHSDAIEQDGLWPGAASARLGVAHHAVCIILTPESVLRAPGCAVLCGSRQGFET